MTAWVLRSPFPLSLTQPTTTPRPLSQAIAALLSPLFSAGYAATVAYAPALMFVVIAVCCVVASLIVLYVRVTMT